MVLYKVTIPEFKTHVQQSANKWKKINGQSIYTGAHHRVRQKFVEDIHAYLKEHIGENENVLIKESPVEIQVKIHAPINYGDVRRMRGKICWKTPAENYEPTWDLDNFAWIWIKCIQDVLQHQNIVSEDTVKHIRKVSYEYIPCETLDDRKIEVTISTSDPKWKKLWDTIFN